MLEHTRLLIFPWMVAVPSFLGLKDRDKPGVLVAEPIRKIADSTGDLLGFARWREKSWPKWLSWMAGQDMEILETEDASLLFSLRRLWRPPRVWEVRDAEESRVGSVWRGVLWDAQGQRLATTMPSTSAGAGQLVGPQQTVLASWSVHSDHTLELHLGQQVNPFVRMILLGAMLLH